ncbi:MAG: HAD-IIB family hydrolase, partial [Selenomonadaceae bacterium]
KSVVTVVPDFDKMATEDIYQIMLGCRAEDHAKLIDGVSGAKVTAWWDRAADIIPATGGKGIAVQEMLDYFQLKKEDAIAFGDGGNDIDMLEAVGMGVAMGNAKADVKAIANTVCGRVDEDGISLYLGL